MSHERRLAVGGGAAVLVLVLVAVFLIRRGQEVTAPPPSRASTARAAEPERAGDDTEAARARAEARRARDAMRTDILAALRRRDAGGTPPPARPRPATAASAPTPPPDEEPPRGRYEPSYIQEHFREDMFPLLKQCYASALLAKPTLSGRLVLKFSIVGDPDVGGIVEGAEIADESDLKDKEMETCVRESLMTLTFDKPPSGGGYVSVTYPVAFAPDDPPPEEGGTPAP